MLLNNLLLYQNLLKKSKEEVVQREDKRYEVERLYSTSPIIFDYSETYMPDGGYMVEHEVNSKSTADERQSTPLSAREQWQNSANKTTTLTFSPCPVIKLDPDAEKPVSTLSRLIEDSAATQEEEAAAAQEGGVALTIYLPDCNSLAVNVKETSNFRDVIMKILLTHEKLGLEPPLVYNDPGMYELRIHEGDGEPDRDFPALGSEKLLSDFNLDEYCICVVEGRRARSGTTSARGGGATANNNNTGNTMTDNSMSTFSPAVPSSGMSGLRQSPSLGLLSSAGGGGGGSTTGRARDDTGDTLGERTHRDRDRTRTSSKQSEDSFQNSAIVSTVLVLFPDGTQVVVPFKEDTLLLDLLPKISKLKRLRLFTNEYVFCVSAADQKHLKLMSPQLDLQQPLRTIGVNTIEIHNKVYMDTGKVDAKNSAASKKKREKAAKKASNKSNFTEAMANAYQEWNVVKKNKFGRKQERVFGVDGKKIYNSKRGQLRGGNQTGVQRAERNISTIVKLDILATDPKTFRITWMDDRDVYNIEYTCETTRECAEIVAKINYTREKYK